MGTFGGWLHTETVKCFLGSLTVLHLGKSLTEAQMLAYMGTILTLRNWGIIHWIRCSNQGSYDLNHLI